MWTRRRAAAVCSACPHTCLRACRCITPVSYTHLDVYKRQVLGVFLLLCGRQMAGLFLAEPSAEILTVVQRFLLITAVPGILAGVMQVYQQVLRGVDKANQALMGGVMQLITKMAVVAVGA